MMVLARDSFEVWDFDEIIGRPKSWKKGYSNLNGHGCRTINWP